MAKEKGRGNDGIEGGGMRGREIVEVPNVFHSNYRCNGKPQVLTRLRSEATPFPVAPMTPLLPALEDMLTYVWSFSIEFLITGEEWFLN